MEKLLHERGIRTLLFSGCNLDQCVARSLQDAFTKRWDCLLLSDGTARNNPEYARKCIEFNAEEGWAVLSWFTENRVRNPLPHYLVWDLATPWGDNFDYQVADAMSGRWRQNYWLDIGSRDIRDIKTVIEAAMDQKENKIIVYSAEKYLRILLRPRMAVSLAQDIYVVLHDKDKGTAQTLDPIKLGWSTKVIDGTLARNDRQLVFCSDIVLTQKSDGTWGWATNSPPQRGAAKL